MHTANSKSHPPEISQPDIHPSATSKGSYPPATHRQRQKTKSVNSKRGYTQRQGPHLFCSLLHPQVPGPLPGIL